MHTMTTMFETATQLRYGRRRLLRGLHAPVLNLVKQTEKFRPLFRSHLIIQTHPSQLALQRFHGRVWTAHRRGSSGGKIRGYSPGQSCRRCCFNWFRVMSDRLGRRWTRRCCLWCNRSFRASATALFISIIIASDRRMGIKCLPIHAKLHTLFAHCLDLGKELADPGILSGKTGLASLKRLRTKHA